MSVFNISLDLLPVAVAVYEKVDDAFVFVAFNQRAQEIEEIQECDVVGKRLIDVFPGVEEFGLIEVMNRVYETSIKEQFDTAFYEDNRISGWRKNEVVKLPTGEIATFYDDMTFEKALKEKEVKLEAQLNETEALLEHQRNIFQYIMEESDTISVQGYNTNHEVIYWNKASESFYGYRKEEVLGKKLEELIIPEFMRDAVHTGVEAWIHDNIEVPSSELVLVDKEGNDVHVYSQHVMIDLGDTKEMYCLDIDLRKRKDLEKDLHKQYDLTQTIVNTVPIRIFWKDKEGCYRGANKLFLKDAQLDSLDDILGKTDFEMPWATTEAQAYRDDDLEVITTGVSKINYEETQTSTTGESIVVLTSKVPLRDESGEIIGALGVYSDITHMRSLEHELAKQQQQLITQSRLAQMGEMISMIAHQWRQPLGAISASIINLRLRLELEDFDFTTKEGAQEASDYFLEQFEGIDVLVHNLTTTIDDFRNFYKSNKKSVVVSFQDVAEKALRIIKTSLINDDIKLTYHYNADVKLELYDNEIMQVLLNILKNSQDNFKEKETENPEIIITVNENCISICDNGGGVPEALLDKIFDPYFSTKSGKNGTGLGLSMSKTIIEEHHEGSLKVFNTENGVCFKIEVGISLHSKKACS